MNVARENLAENIKNSLTVRDEIQKRNESYENELKRLNEAVSRGESTEASIREQLSAVTEQHRLATEGLNSTLAVMEEQNDEITRVTEELENQLKLKKEENETLNQKMDELSTENKRLTNTISQFTVYEDQNGRIKTLTKQLKDVRQSALTANKNLQHLNEALKQSKESILDLKSELKTIIHQHSQAKIENARLNHTLLDLEKEVIALRDNNKNSEIALQEQQQLTLQADQAVKRLEKTLASERGFYFNAQVKIVELNAAHELAKKDILKSSDANETLNKRLNELDDKHRLKVAGLETELASSKEQLKVSQHELTKSQEELKASNQALLIEYGLLKNKAEEIDAIRELLTRKNQSLDDELKQIGEDNINLSLELKKEQSQHSELLKLLSLQTGEIQFYEGQYLALMRANKQLLDQNTDLAPQIQEQQQLNALLNTQVEDLQLQLASIISELDAAKASLILHESNAKVSANEIIGLSGELKTHSKCADEANNNLISLTVDYKNQENELKESNLHVDQLKKELTKLNETYELKKNELQKQLETSKIQLEDSSIKLDKMQLALNDSTAEITGLQHDLDEQAQLALAAQNVLIKQNNLINEQLAQLGDDNQKLARKLKAKHDDNASLQKSLKEETSQANQYFNQCISQRKENATLLKNGGMENILQS